MIDLTNRELALLGQMLSGMAKGMGYPQVGELLNSIVVAAPALAKGSLAAYPFVTAAVHLAQNGGHPDEHRWAELLAGLKRNSQTLQEIAARDASDQLKE